MNAECLGTFDGSRRFRKASHFVASHPLDQSPANGKKRFIKELYLRGKKSPKRMLTMHHYDYFEILCQSTASLRKVVDPWKSSNDFLHGNVLWIVIPHCGIKKQPITPAFDEIKEVPRLRSNKVRETSPTQIRRCWQNNLKWWAFCSMEPRCQPSFDVIVHEIREKGKRHLAVLEHRALQREFAQNRIGDRLANAENKLMIGINTRSNQYVSIWNCIWKVSITFVTVAMMLSL